MVEDPAASRKTRCSSNEAISAYLDGEGTAAERIEVEKHTASCAECAERLASFRALKHGVARLEGRATPPEAIRARIGALRFRPTLLRRRLRRSLAAGVVAAVAVGALAVGRLWPNGGAERPLLEELIADHLRSAPEVMPAEVASADPTEVRRFFREKIPFEPVVPRLAAAQLIGGRVCKIEGRKVQLLFYELGERRLSLYISDRPAARRGCYSDGEHGVCAERRGHLSLMLVGRAPERQLRALLDEAVL